LQFNADGQNKIRVACIGASISYGARDRKLKAKWLSGTISKDAGK
jgi:hypothetical protein